MFYVFFIKIKGFFYDKQTVSNVKKSYDKNGIQGWKNDTRGTFNR